MIDYSKYDSWGEFSIGRMAWMLCGERGRNKVTYDDPQDVQDMQETLKQRIKVLYPEKYPRPKSLHRPSREEWREITADMLKAGEISGLPPLLYPEERPGSDPIDGATTDALTDERYMGDLSAAPAEEKPDDGRLMQYGGPRPDINSLPNPANEDGSVKKPSTKKQYYEWLACARWLVCKGETEVKAIGRSIADAISEKGGTPRHPDTITRKLNEYFRGWLDPSWTGPEGWKDPAEE